MEGDGLGVGDRVQSLLTREIGMVEMVVALPANETQGIILIQYQEKIHTKWELIKNIRKAKDEGLQSNGADERAQGGK